MREHRLVTVTLNPAVDRVIEAPGFAVGSQVTGRIIAQYPTGRGITMSRALAALGQRSIATGFVGRGELGMFEEHLERIARGRAVVQFLVVRARTRDNISVVDPVEDSETHIRDAGFAVQPDDVQRIESKLAMLARRETIMCFGGSLPPGIEPDRFAHIVSRCSSQGALVALDVSTAALEAVRDQKIWLVRVNSKQLAGITGQTLKDDDQFVSAARSLASSGGGAFQHVVATRGADGACLVGPDVTLLGRVSCHPGRVVSTAGCAECLVAGLVASTTTGKGWTEAFREGLAVATANAIGREAGEIDDEDLAEFRFMAMVEELGESTSA